LQSPFSRVKRLLTTEHMVSCHEKQNHEQDGKQGAAKEKGKQHAYRNPE